MKKFICTIIIAVFTLISSAFTDGGPTCKVRGLNNVIASINSTKVTATKDYKGTPFVSISVQLTKAVTEETYVVVKVYDENECIGSAQIRIGVGDRTGSGTYKDGIKVGKVYRLSLADAFCEL